VQRPCSARQNPYPRVAATPTWFQKLGRREPTIFSLGDRSSEGALVDGWFCSRMGHLLGSWPPVATPTADTKAAQNLVKMATSLASTQFRAPRLIQIHRHPGPRGYSHQQSRCIVQESRSLSIREMPAYAPGYFPCVCPCPVQRFGCRLRRWLWASAVNDEGIKSTRESGITSSLVCLRSQTSRKDHQGGGGSASRSLFPARSTGLEA